MAYIVVYNHNLNHTSGATKTTETAAGLSGDRIGVHPEDESTANASVRTPPANSVIEE